jgi:hypothetical protein
MQGDLRHRTGTTARDFGWLNWRVLSERTAVELVGAIDVDLLGACPLCLFDLAWELHVGRIPSRGLVSRTVDWVWLEIEESLKQAVVRLRMQEAPHAEDALYDLELNGSHGVLARAVVERLAFGLAAEISRRSV